MKAPAPDPRRAGRLATSEPGAEGEEADGPSGASPTSDIKPIAAGVGPRNRGGADSVCGFHATSNPSSLSSTASASANGVIADSEIARPSIHAFNVSDSIGDTAQPPRPGWTDSIKLLAENVLQIGMDVASYWGKRIWRRLQSHQDPQVYYKHLQSVATNYEQWAAAGLALDRLQGKDRWKAEMTSSDYDYVLLEDRLAQLKAARLADDLPSMIYILRTSLSRNLGDMGNPKLYAHCNVGTKHLIDDFIDEVIKQLNAICDTDYPDVDFTTKYEFFTNMQRALGRTALLLSGGAVLGLVHIGVVKTLFETNLLPRVISGASAGSIVASMLCTRTDEELPALFDPKNINLEFFERASEKGNLITKMNRIITHRVLFDVEVLIETMRMNLGDLTFQEAFNRTRRVLNIAVSSSTGFEMPRLLNYLTAPNVLIWSAVVASSAVPYVYRSAPLMAKDRLGTIVAWNPSGHRWIDGSVENDLPMARIAELFNVNHFIVSQVNPHIIPFMQTNRVETFSSKLLAKCAFLLRSELLHRLNQLSSLGLSNSLIYRIKAILVQRYYGDITIVPSVSIKDFTTIVSNPTEDMMTAYTIKGERATWREVTIIKKHCQIEMALDEIIYRLRVQKIKGNSGDSGIYFPKGPRRRFGGMTAIDSEPVTWKSPPRMPSM
ncbi:acyl transferase/acyl hydrolase/lysophospholipase [Zopfochytrium polystomum]|nr:acyl transferase/acyl hydrolase/lysophospholipase [Zopfochytrium polystomum]